MSRSGLRLLPLGVGDAFSARRYSFCLALESDDVWLLVDCPHPVRKMLREAADTAGLALDVNDVAAVVITHLHADHCSGLESFGYFSRFLLGQRARLLAHEDVSARLWEASLAAGMEQLLVGDERARQELTFEDYFELSSLQEDAAVTFGPFTIECRRTIHHIPTTALRIRAGGKAVGISADTAFDPGLLAWLHDGTDLVVHETNHGPAHTPYEALASLPADVRARTRLIHYPDELDLESSVIEPLCEGLLYDV